MACVNWVKYFLWSHLKVSNGVGEMIIKVYPKYKISDSGSIAGQEPPGLRPGHNRHKQEPKKYCILDVDNVNLEQDWGRSWMSQDGSCLNGDGSQFSMWLSFWQHRY